MIRVELVAVLVDTTLMFTPTGDVNRWTRRVAFEIENEAKLKAPPRRSKARHGTWATGALAASIDANVDADPVARIITADIGSNLPHAMYVHDGTADQGSGYIYTTKGYANRQKVNWWAMTRTPVTERGYLMPVRRYGRTLRYALLVRGQYPNPFLRDGYNAVARRHQALPRMR